MASTSPMPCTSAEENVLAVKVDNRTDYKERATGTPFEWNANDFNPDHGGINRHVWLHVTGKIHQTLPLYYGLETSGVYVHAANFDIPKKTADITVDSEVRNDSGERATVGLSAVIVDHRGQVRARFEGDPVDMANGEKKVLTASGALRKRALLEYRRSLPLQRVHHPQSWRKGCRRREDHHRISQNRIQGRRRNGRRLPQRQVCLPQRLRAALQR